MIEKMSPTESVCRASPAVSGTTGYEWLNTIMRVLLDERGLEALDHSWHEASGDARSFAEILIDAKRRVVANSLASDFTVLSRCLRVSPRAITPRAIMPRNDCAPPLSSSSCIFPSIAPTSLHPARHGEDRAIINATIARARADWFGPDIGIFDFLRDA